MLSNRWLLDISKLAIVVIVFVLLYKSGKIGFDTLRLVTNSLGLVLMALILIFCSTVCSVERWRRLLLTVDVHIGFCPAFTLTFIGVFFSIVLPGVVGGDLAKAYYLAKGQSRRSLLVGTVIFDRLLGLYTMILMATLAGSMVCSYVWLSGSSPAWWNSSIYALILFIFGLFVTINFGMVVFMSDSISRTRFMKKALEVVQFRENVGEIYSATRKFGNNLALVFRALGISFIGQFFLYVAIWILALALELNELTVVQFLFVIPLCLLVNAIPFAPGGLGVGEIGFGAVFALFGSGKGVELAVMYHSVSITLAFVLGGILYFVKSRGKDSLVSLKILEDVGTEDTL